MRRLVSPLLFANPQRQGFPCRTPNMLSTHKHNISCSSVRCNVNVYDNNCIGCSNLMLHSKCELLGERPKGQYSTAKQLNGPIGFEIVLKLGKCHLFRWIHTLILFLLQTYSHLVSETRINLSTIHWNMRGLRNFRQGGSRSVWQKKLWQRFFFLFFFSPQLILQKSNGQFQRNL